MPLYFALLPSQTLCGAQVVIAVSVAKGLHGMHSAEGGKGIPQVGHRRLHLLPIRWPLIIHVPVAVHLHFTDYAD